LGSQWSPYGAVIADGELGVLRGRCVQPRRLQIRLTLPPTGDCSSERLSLWSPSAQSVGPRRVRTIRPHNRILSTCRLHWLRSPTFRWAKSISKCVVLVHQPDLASRVPHLARVTKAATWCGDSPSKPCVQLREVRQSASFRVLSTLR